MYARSLWDSQFFYLPRFRKNWSYPFDYTAICTSPSLYFSKTPPPFSLCMENYLQKVYFTRNFLLVGKTRVKLRPPPCTIIVAANSIKNPFFSFCWYRGGKTKRKTSWQKYASPATKSVSHKEHAFRFKNIIETKVPKMVQKTGNELLSSNYEHLIVEKYPKVMLNFFAVDTRGVKWSEKKLQTKNPVCW